MIVSVLIRHSQSIQTLILIWLRKLDIAAKLSINVTRNSFVVLLKKKKNPLGRVSNISENYL